MATRARKKTPSVKAETIASSTLRCDICREMRRVTSLAFTSHVTQKSSRRNPERVLVLVYCTDKPACSESAREKR